MAADGEILIHPDDVLKIGAFYSPQRDIDNYPASRARMMRRAHRVLDAFVKQTRGATIKHLRSLKGPVGSENAKQGHT